MASWSPKISPIKEAKKEIVGIDVFVHANPEKWSPDAIAEKIRSEVRLFYFANLS